MNQRLHLNTLTLSIAAVERDTGLSKDTLRVWERRYGFPAPQRDAGGERAYSLADVDKLRVLKRLLDVGHRPGRIVPLALPALQLLAEQTLDLPLRAAEPGPAAADLGGLLSLVRGHDIAALRAELTRAISRLGVARFVLEVAGPLSAAVGDAWLRGQMEVFEEHACTEALQAVLRQAVAGIPGPASPGGPCVLLSTFPGEPHGLGLLMAEALLALEGCRCVGLGVQTPLWDIVLAAGAYRADIVALGFTGCMNPNQVVDGLAELRRKLPPAVQLWAGGGAPVLVRRTMPGVLPLGSLQELPAALSHWREGAGSRPSAATSPLA
jgi:methanogenic corrinoid protein MtbC1